MAQFDNEGHQVIVAINGRWFRGIQYKDIRDAQYDLRKLKAADINDAEVWIEPCIIGCC